MAAEDRWQFSGPLAIESPEAGVGLEIDQKEKNEAALLLNSSGPGWGSGMEFRNDSQNAKKRYGIYAGADGSLHFEDIDRRTDPLRIDASGRIYIAPVWQDHNTPALTVGTGGDGFIRVRHVQGKHFESDEPDTLFLNAHAGKDVQVGVSGTPSKLLVTGDLTVGAGGGGDLSVGRDIAVGSKHAIRGNDAWLRLNQDGAFPNGVHTPGVLSPMSLNVGGRESWEANPGNGNAWIAGSVSYDGQLNKLDVDEGDNHARIRAHDLWLGHSSRGQKKNGTGSIGRALVDGTTNNWNGNPTLFINFARDWEAVVIDGIIHNPSSRQLKEDIQILSSQRAKHIISTLEPVRFTYKRDALKVECLGFIAEDAPPEVAGPAHDTVIMNHVIASLTRVVKDQQESIGELEARVNCLTQTLQQKKHGV